MPRDWTTQPGEFRALHEGLALATPPSRPAADLKDAPRPRPGPDRPDGDGPRAGRTRPARRRRWRGQGKDVLNLKPRILTRPPGTRSAGGTCSAPPSRPAAADVWSLATRPPPELLHLLLLLAPRPVSRLDLPARLLSGNMSTYASLIAIVKTRRTPAKCISVLPVAVRLHSYIVIYLLMVWRISL